MGRLLWPLALVVTFLLGLAAASVVKNRPSAVHEVEIDQLRETVNRLQQQVDVLQARLRVRESLAVVRHPEAPGHPPARRESSAVAGSEADRSAAAAVTDDSRAPAHAASRAGAAQLQGGSAADRPSSQPGSASTVTPPATVEMALDRFYRYLETTNASQGRERWQRARELLDDLRAMGPAGAQALMQVLATGSDTDERRAAARLLGTLQVPEALPLLRDVLQKEDDLLLRRAAAAGLRQLHTPESVGVMERILATPGEDRFVRLSAAYGLAESGRPLGVTGLAQIFEESTSDGRGREMAFRALSSLKDERPLAFMRQLVISQAEPPYRLQAIRYLSAHGDRQSLAALQVVMQSPHEQPSIRDAAAHAHASISSR